MAALLTALPLFPLGTVLFPGGLLPLRIFEVRYLDMIRRCHRSGEPFGVVTLTEGAEVRAAGAPAERFAPVGTLAHIDELQSPQPGLLVVRCRGGQRFRLQRSELLKHGLWTGDADCLDDDRPVAVPDDLRPAADSLRQLLDQLAERHPPDQLPVPPPWHFGDCGWLANRWCELLPLSPPLQLRLMELDNPLVRLELVNDLLARAQPAP